MSNPPFDELLLGDNKNRLNFILTPLSCDKRDIYKYLIKYSELISNNHYLVTLDKSDNDDKIDYDEFIKYESSSNGKYFFIDNIRFFMFYNIEYFNKSNTLIFLISISDLEEIPYIYITDNFKVNIYYPKNLCLDINLEYKKVSTNIYKKQLIKYKKEYLKFVSEQRDNRDLSISKEFDKQTLNNPANFLNVFYDNIIPSLENVSLETALDRAPKFKNIFLELLLQNKKRHLVHMVDNRYGIEPFEIIYNKLNTKVPLVVIKTTDDYDKKLKFLADFNKDNSPKILLTDYIFTGYNIPKNISLYHITDGGSIENVYSIFEHIKTINKYSSDDKKFMVINHIASTLKGELTIDNIKELNFGEILNKYSVRYNVIKKDAGKIFLEGNEIKYSNPEILN